MDLKALQLISRFSLPPNSLGYCGKNTAPEKLIGCVLDNRTSGITDELEKFIVLNPYLETLARITRLNKFSYPVIEAYCLGNNQLKKAGLSDYLTLLKYFSKQGVPPWLVTELKNNPPRVFIPFHLFQVLFVGVGRASGTLPYNLKTINNCMVRWGKVTSLKNNSLKVDLHSLKAEKNYYRLHVKAATFPFRSDFLPRLKVGDHVAVHWQQVVKVLNSREVKNIDYWTRQTLSSVALYVK
jgi:hypothetical protein